MAEPEPRIKVEVVPPCTARSVETGGDETDGCAEMVEVDQQMKNEAFMEANLSSFPNHENRSCADEIVQYVLFLPTTTAVAT